MFSLILHLQMYFHFVLPFSQMTACSKMIDIDINVWFYDFRSFKFIKNPVLITRLMFHVGDESPLIQSSTSRRTLTKLFSGSGLVLKIYPETRHRGLTEVSTFYFFLTVNYLTNKQKKLTKKNPVLLSLKCLWFSLPLLINW